MVFLHFGVLFRVPVIRVPLPVGENDSRELTANYYFGHFLVQEGPGRLSEC